jgi:hypothetical protein
MGMLFIPAFQYASKRQRASGWLPAVGVPAFIVWFLLIAVGVGEQSLGNLLEAVWLAAPPRSCCATFRCSLSIGSRRTQRATPLFSPVLSWSQLS